MVHRDHYYDSLWKKYFSGQTMDETLESAACYFIVDIPGVIIPFCYIFQIDNYTQTFLSFHLHL